MSRRQDLRILAAYANAPEQFPSGNVPIAYAAEKMGKDACFIRAGIEARMASNRILHLEKLERAGRTITSVQSCSGKSQGSYGDQRKEHKDAYRNKSNDLHGSSADRDGNL